MTPIRNPGHAAALIVALLAPFAFAAAAEDEASVRPGINDKYLAEDLDVDEWVKRFEVESREIYVARKEIADRIGLAPGATVADVGAGTGLFLEPFAERVGPEGRVLAVDISPRFLEHLRARVAAEGLGQATVIEGAARSARLPEGEVDLIFVCDTYHHFEYPKAMLASLRRALRPGGHLVVIDFERIPGETRPFLMEHVRAGKEVFRAEIEAAGFAPAEALDIPGLEENYALRFRRLPDS